MGFGDGLQLVIKHPGKREQIVTLILQRDTHRSDALAVQMFAFGQLGSHEIKQFNPGTRRT